jgi:hypothetical protein
VRRVDRIAALALIAIAFARNAAAQDGQDSDPHAHARGAPAMPGFFEPPQDASEPDPTSAPGTITVDLRNAENQPVRQEMVTLGVLINSIARGDSRRHVQSTTDDHGRVVFSGLETASNIAYRVSSGFQGGLFGAPPFQLEQAKAMHVVLHVYPVTHELQQTMIVTEATLAAEIRDDRIVVEEALKFYNLGRMAWQPEDVVLKLPESVTAFNAQPSMSDQRVEEEQSAARIKGTFPPGQHTLDFRWQLPWSGERDLDFEVGLPPHVAGARVMMPAGSDITLTAYGFPTPVIRRDSRGLKFLVTERQLRPDDAKLTRLSIGIHGLPTPGPARLIATLMAASAVAFGLRFAFVRPPSPSAGDPKTPLLDASIARSTLLAELTELERARATGDVGPKTYERARNEIIDALARTLAG